MFTQKFEMLQVSAKACTQVFELQIFQSLSAFQRVRDESHAQFKRILPDEIEDKPKFFPHGPLWHKESGKMWLLKNKRVKSKSGEPTIQNCSTCNDPKSDTESKHTVTFAAK